MLWLYSPLKQVALSMFKIPVRLLLPLWSSTINDVEKGITKADLGLNPQSDGHTLRLPIPTLTEERRKELDKVVKKMAEDARIALRNIRRDFMETTKKNKLLSEDDLKRQEHEIQKVTDHHNSLVDDLLKHKEKEIMEIWMAPSVVPKHVAIIMDGNGRWAQQRVSTYTWTQTRHKVLKQTIKDAYPRDWVPRFMFFQPKTGNDQKWRSISWNFWLFTGQRSHRVTREGFKFAFLESSRN